MNQHLEQLKETTKNPEVHHLDIKRSNKLTSDTSRQLSAIENTKQNLISVEQFDKAGQQISSIRGVISSIRGVI